MLLLLFSYLRSKIKIEKDSMFSLSFENYDKNFIFIVNHKKFHTSRIVADILSPKINQLHATEPKTNSFTINTQNSGNFSFFLQLINFNFNEIPQKEIPFINEIASILETQFIEIIDDSNEEELTLDKAIKNLNVHSKYKYIYSKQIEKEIDFIATHFYKVNKKQKLSICSFKKFIIDQIFNHTQLFLKSEDQLLKIINNFYNNDTKYSYMYEFVEFSEVSPKCLSNFLKSFNYNDLTEKVWNSISNRLESNKNDDNTTKKHQYFGKFLPYHNDTNLNGIINYLRKKVRDINNEVNVTASSYNDDNRTSHSVINYEDIDKTFITKNLDDSWICIEFKNHLIIPFNYTIINKNYDNVDILKSWIIEGSNDKNNWFLVDERINFKSFIVHTFDIKPISKSMKYFRIKMTDKSWQGRGYLEMNAIEIYGLLI